MVASTNFRVVSQAEVLPTMVMVIPRKAILIMESARVLESTEMLSSIMVAGNRTRRMV